MAKIARTLQQARASSAYKPAPVKAPSPKPTPSTAKPASNAAQAIQRMQEEKLRQLQWQEYEREKRLREAQTQFNKNVQRDLHQPNITREQRQLIQYTQGNVNREFGSLQKDIGQQKATLYALAAGSPLAQDVLKALQHEGKPDYLSDEKYLLRFARLGWDTVEDEKAYQLLKLRPPAQDVQEEIPVDTVRDVLSVLIQSSPYSSDLVYKYVHAEDITANPDLFEELLEQAFGYEITFGAFLPTDDDKLRQLTRLAQSNLTIVHYLDSLGLPGVKTFNEVFSKSPYSSDPSQAVTVYLGEDPKTQFPGQTLAQAAYQGYVPLPAPKEEDNEANSEELGKIYLGSNVSAATITHEFFHQLDRYFGLLPSDRESPDSLNQYLLNSVELTLERAYINPDSGASSGDQSIYDEEIFADLAMTAVLDSMGFTVDPYGDSPEIRFRDTINAQFFECAFRQYLYQIFSGQKRDFKPCT